MAGKGASVACIASRVGSARKASNASRLAVMACNKACMQCMQNKHGRKGTQAKQACKGQASMIKSRNETHRKHKKADSKTRAPARS